MADVREHNRHGEEVGAVEVGVGAVETSARLAVFEYHARRCATVRESVQCRKEEHAGWRLCSAALGLWAAGLDNRMRAYTKDCWMTTHQPATGHILAR